MSRHPLKEEKNELFTVIENYHQMGYDDISQALTQYASAIDNFCNNAQSKYIIEGVSICKTDSRQLKGNITITQKGNIPVSQITDFLKKSLWHLQNIKNERALHKIQKVGNDMATVLISAFCSALHSNNSSAAKVMRICE